MLLVCLGGIAVLDGTLMVCFGVGFWWGCVGIIGGS